MVEVVDLVEEKADSLPICPNAKFVVSLDTLLLTIGIGFILNLVVHLVLSHRNLKCLFHQAHQGQELIYL